MIFKGCRKELRRFESYEAQETLGVFIAPDGNTTKQHQKMQKLAVHWADCMRTGRISKDDAWLSFQSTIWKTLSYPLSALNLSRKECDQIMAPILQYLLPAIGVCRNFPRHLIYTSEQYMGLGVKHPHTTQEICRLKDIISHVSQRTNTGILYRNTLELLILELGMGTVLHLIKEEVLSLLATDSLIKSTVQFLLQHGIELHHDIILLPLRENDCLLMPRIMSLSPTDEELLSFNKCRIFLQVSFLSEICSGDGLALTEDAWRGEKI